MQRIFKRGDKGLPWLSVHVGLSRSFQKLLCFLWTFARCNDQRYDEIKKEAPSQSDRVEIEPLAFDRKELNDGSATDGGETPAMSETPDLSL